MSSATSSPSPESGGSEPGASASVPAVLVALLGPLLVFGSFLAITLGEPVADPSGEGEQDPELVAFESELAAADPSVLFLGSSLVGRAVHPEEMGRLLGQPSYVLWRSNASTPQWYAMLKNRAYGATEVEPELVVIGSTLRRMLLNEPRGERQRTNLLEQLGDYEPVIERKAFGKDVRDSPLALLRFRRSQLKDSLLDGVKGLTMMGLSPTADSVDAGISEADEVLERVFGGENARDFDLGSRVIPVVDSKLIAEAEEVGETASVEDNFIGDFVELAAEHGARVIFVNLPVTAGAKARETASPEEERAAMVKMRSLGAGYIDLSDAEALGLERSHFRDSTHLNEAGGAIFTKALAVELEAVLEVSEDAALPMPVGVGVEASWSRTGATVLPALSLTGPVEGEPCHYSAKLEDVGELSSSLTRKVGLHSPLQVLADGVPLTRTGKRSDAEAPGCTGVVYYKGQTVMLSLPSEQAAAKVALGLHPEPVLALGENEAVWLAPGTELGLSFARPMEPGPLSIDLVGLGFGQGSEAPVLRLPGGEEVPLESTGNRWHVSTVLDCGQAETCDLAVVGPAEGPWVAFKELQLQVGEDPLAMMGDSVDEAFETRLNLQGDSKLAPSYAAPAPSLGINPPVRDGGQGAGRLMIESYAFMSTKVVRAATLENNATPIELLEDGEPMLLRGCRVVRKDKTPNTYCESQGKVFFTPSDGSDPLSGTHSYTLRLKEDRISHGRWLYPGDTLEFGLRANRMVALHEGPTSIEMSVYAFAPEASEGAAAVPPLQVRVESGEAALVDVSLSLEEIGDGGKQSWAAQPGFNPKTSLRAKLHNPEGSGVFYLLRETYAVEQLGQAAPEEAQP